MFAHYNEITPVMSFADRIRWFFLRVVRLGPPYCRHAVRALTPSDSPIGLEFAPVDLEIPTNSVDYKWRRLITLLVRVVDLRIPLRDTTLETISSGMPLFCPIGCACPMS